MKGYTAITGWVADVPPAILADLYLRSGAAPAPPPSKTTIWRVLTDADTEAFDVAVGTWLMDLAGFAAPAAGRAADRVPGDGALMQVRLDGKAIRGAKDAGGNQVRLLAALVGPGAAASVVAAQAEVGKKTNEVPVASVVLGQIDLEGKIVTADALHTVKAAILIALSGTSSGEPKNAAGIALLAVVLAGLFAVRLFLAERHGPDEAQVWWLRRQNPAVGGGPERLVNALVAFVDADSAAARTVDDAIRRRARGPRRGRLRAEWRRHDEARSQALRRLDWIASRNVLEVAGELVDRQRSLAVAVLDGVCPPADPRIATYQETRRRFIEEMRRTLGAGDVERVETTVEDA